MEINRHSTVRYDTPKVSLTAKYRLKRTVPSTFVVKESTFKVLQIGMSGIEWVRGTWGGYRGVLPWAGNQVWDVAISGGASKLAIETARGEADVWTDQSDITDFLHAVQMAGAGNCKEYETATTIYAGVHIENKAVFKASARGISHAFTVIGDPREEESIILDAWVAHPYPFLTELMAFVLDKLEAQYPVGPRPELIAAYNKANAMWPKYDLSNPTDLKKLFKDSSKNPYKYLMKTAHKEQEKSFLFAEEFSCDHPYVTYVNQQNLTDTLCFDQIPAAQYYDMQRRIGSAGSAGFPNDMTEEIVSRAEQNYRRELNSFKSRYAGDQFKGQLQKIETAMSDVLNHVGQGAYLDLRKISPVLCGSLTSRLVKSLETLAKRRGIFIEGLGLPPHLERWPHWVDDLTALEEIDCHEFRGHSVELDVLNEGGRLNFSVASDSSFQTPKLKRRPALLVFNGTEFFEPQAYDTTDSDSEDSTRISSAQSVDDADIAFKPRGIPEEIDALLEANALRPARKDCEGALNEISEAIEVDLNCNGDEHPVIVDLRGCSANSAAEDLTDDISRLYTSAKFFSRPISILAVPEGLVKEPAWINEFAVDKILFRGYAGKDLNLTCLPRNSYLLVDVSSSPNLQTLTVHRGTQVVGQAPDTKIVYV